MQNTDVKSQGSPVEIDKMPTVEIRIARFNNLLNEIRKPGSEVKVQRKQLPALLNTYLGGDLTVDQDNAFLERINSVLDIPEPTVEEIMRSDEVVRMILEGSFTPVDKAA